MSLTSAVQIVNVGKKPLYYSTAQTTPASSLASKAAVTIDPTPFLSQGYIPLYYGRSASDVAARRARKVNIWLNIWPTVQVTFDLRSDRGRGRSCSRDRGSGSGSGCESGEYKRRSRSASRGSRSSSRSRSRSGSRKKDCSPRRRRHEDWEMSPIPAASTLLNSSASSITYTVTLDGVAGSAQTLAAGATVNLGAFYDKINVAVTGGSPSSGLTLPYLVPCPGQPSHYAVVVASSLALSSSIVKDTVAYLPGGLGATVQQKTPSSAFVRDITASQAAKYYGYSESRHERKESQKEAAWGWGIAIVFVVGLIGYANKWF